MPGMRRPAAYSLAERSIGSYLGVLVATYSERKDGSTVEPVGRGAE
jgi:hypothetical protein